MLHRRGFTLLELMVVVAIIAILAGMVMAVLAILRKQQRTASTWDLMTHMHTAMDMYLRESPRLGNPTSSDFLADPWEFFYKAQHRLKKPTYLELPLHQVVKKTAQGASLRADSLTQATHIVDHFGSNSANVLSFTILNHSRGSGDKFVYAQCILLRSSAGTLGDPKDDLVFGFNSDKASWRKLRINDFEDFAKEIDRSPAPVLETKWTDPLSY
jgi:prepilin-type N-terminal cleavage/methylation domain-containing protein